MLEVLGRSGPARTARWTVGETKIMLPQVIHLEPGPGPNLQMVTIDGQDEFRGPHGEGPLFNVPHSLHPPIHHLRRDDSFLPLPGTNSLTIFGDAKRMPTQLKAEKAEVMVLANAFEMRRDARTFVDAVVALRNSAGNKHILYAPGLMEVSNLALLVYAGLDLFDDSLIHYLAGRDLVSTADGTLSVKEAEWAADGKSEEDILKTSLLNLERELHLIRYKVQQQRLRELVEMRVHSSPWMVAALRLLDEHHYHYQEKFYPVVGPRFYANAKQSLTRPDVWRWRQRILERCQKPEHKRILLLLPCSAKKPYSSSKSHQAFRRVLQSVSNFDMVQEIIVTSPLGLVPRELELFYPAAQYDIPVTGHWDREEVAMVQEMVSYVVGQGYDQVICHLGDEAEIVQAVAGGEDTSSGSPTSSHSLSHLREVLEEACSRYERIPFGQDRAASLAAVARFQFGKEAGSLLDGCTVSGTHPYSRITLGKTQLGMLTPERGMISLTLEGAEKLQGKGLGLVQIKDFELQGNLFAIGVDDADANIRIGDEVGVVKNDRLVGVGTALMFGEEMIDSARGEAVRVRHYRKSK